MAVMRFEALLVQVLNRHPKCSNRDMLIGSMPTLAERILAPVGATPGLTDQEMADRIFGSKAPQQSVNQAARTLASRGRVIRRKRSDGKIGNYLDEVSSLDAEKPIPTPSRIELPSLLSEDEVKRGIQSWLEGTGWQVHVIWGKGHGIDIEAQREGQRCVIEAKGGGSRDAMRVNYFLSILGELLQRMVDPNARYSIALPDHRQFRGLWQRLPQAAKMRTRITALFVSDSGEVREQRDRLHIG